ncbi:maleylpyruvate isomerase family mycothiol-dependent enzyme [Mycobacterium sp. DL440]|uniref:maleylpyruvate isomerase family mycothiol-dependent enzyme n=1 Tax=Mycobacterium sp. DL440 TaxID=2675523 RepID=UPI00141E961F|nr:maleylpyruvate isomerase family mycothiol-dependent enzyme [Mycobacterium sp. DL440]
MTIAEDVKAERSALTVSLIELGPSAPTACGDWTALDLAAHLAGEERYGGVTTFIARSLVTRGVSVAGTPKMVDTALRRERRHGFAAVIERLRRPIPRLLLQPVVAPLALFEYWTHHEDLVGFDTRAHAVPATLVEVIPLVLRYQLKKLPAGVRVTVGTSDGDHRWSVGPQSGPEVILGGSPPDLVRWLAGRRAAGEIAMAGPGTTVQELRAFGGRV